MMLSVGDTTLWRWYCNVCKLYCTVSCFLENVCITAWADWLAFLQDLSCCRLLLVFPPSCCCLFLPIYCPDTLLLLIGLFHLGANRLAITGLSRGMMLGYFSKDQDISLASLYSFYHTGSRAKSGAGSEPAIRLPHWPTMWGFFGRYRWYLW